MPGVASQPPLTLSFPAKVAGQASSKTGDRGSPGIKASTPGPSPSTALPPINNPAQLGFSVSHQKVELDLDFKNRSVRGRTEITIYPHSRDLKNIRLNFSQGDVQNASINGRGASWKYQDPYHSLRLHSVHQWRRLGQKLESLCQAPMGSPDLVFAIPKGVYIEELDPYSVEAQDRVYLRVPSGTGPAPSAATDDPADAQSAATKAGEPPKYTALTLSIDFAIDNIRDGLQFIGVANGDGRYPYAYTNNMTHVNSYCCLFPCVADTNARNSWEVALTCPATLDDVFPTLQPNGQPSRDDESTEIIAVCSGDLADEIVDPQNPTKKTFSFSWSAPLSASQIGFAVGPFEYVNLSQFRDDDEDGQLGENAIPVHGFCLPGRADEVRNTCVPLAKAIDFISLSYGLYPFSSFKLCFVDDLACSTISTASLSICSHRLLFPEDVIDHLYDSTRALVYTLACQWVGVNIKPKSVCDTWVTVGLAYYITDTFMRKLCGNNEYRYRQKLMADQVCDIDISRPSLYDLGPLLRLDASQLEFMELKAPLVMYILERRLSKASGKPTISRIISRIFLNARMGELPGNGALTTSYFQRTCERFGHAKLDIFFQQWAYGAGCPRFQATQRFNKKKLVVEMMIRQVQGDQTGPRDLDRDTFMRDVKEETRNVYAGHVQTVFTGPMTIRIHEADGTPYEHIVDIKEGVTKFDIPYNTKYKRLKRNKRQKDRTGAVNPPNTPNAVAGATTVVAEAGSEMQDDVLLYCLGDVLQTEEDVQKWRLVDWSKEDEDRMGQESYEWIRMDADFEWICKMSLTMPEYMYLSQLQQDRDVVAQYESIQYLAAQRSKALVSTMFVRTLMDRRYFHGIRTAAAHALVGHAKKEVDWVGLHHLETAFQELFCLPNSSMTRTNDFSDRAVYLLQLAIPEAMAKVRDQNGFAPTRVKKFLHDKLRFNDNSNNEFSDCYYISTLIRAISQVLLNSPSGQVESSSDSHPENPSDALAMMNLTMEREMHQQAEAELNQECLAEIDRYRRMDEYKQSYHNIFARTTLECQRQLLQAGFHISPDQEALHDANPDDALILHVFPYTRAGLSDFLRVSAFRILASLNVNFLRTSELLTWFLYVMSMDNSAFVRWELHRILGHMLASCAIGDPRDLVESKSQNQGRSNRGSHSRDDDAGSQAHDSSGLVIESESSTQSRTADLARRQTVAGAISALKSEVAQDSEIDVHALQEAFWSACNSPVISTLELSDCLDLCSVLFEPVDHIVTVLKYPRYWKCEHYGKGKLRFFRSKKARTKTLAQIKNKKKGGVQRR